MLSVAQPVLKSYRNHLRETLVLSFPVIIGQVGNLMLNITDNIMIGGVSYIQLAAASLANSVYFIITILAIGSMNVVAPLVAEAIGAGEQSLAGRYLQQGLIKALLISAVSTVLTLLAAEALPLLQQPEEEVALAQQYLRIVSFATPPLIIFLAYKQFCDGLGDTRFGMIVTLGGVLLNVFLNWALIYGKLGLPRLELAGSGFATVTCRVLMALAMGFFVHFHKNYLPYLSGLRFRQANGELLGKLFRLGILMGLQIFFEVAAFSGAAILIGWLPNEATAARAAHQMVLNIAAISFMITLGISVGASIRVGNALGAKDPGNLRRAGYAALALGLGYMIFSAAIMIIFKHELPTLYGVEEPVVLRISARLMVIAGIFQIFDGTQAIAAGLLRGLQDVRFPTWITFAAYWVIWIPLAYVWGFPLGYGVDGIWYADVVALAFAAVMLTWRFWTLAGRRWEGESVGG
jgi:MATE family multidrug resistance protein